MTGTMIIIILAAAVLTALAIGMSVILGWANVAFHVEVDPRVEKINDALPGANCGGCGYVGCNDYAEAIVRGECEVTLCGPGGPSCAQKIAEIMGVEIGEALPYRAVVHCNAKVHQRHQRSDYHGEKTCAAANLIPGIQGCVYGCLGFGDCERACKYDAIHVIDGLAHVDYDKCIGCKACALACPRNIITMVPFKASEMLVVACSNQDTGPEVKEVCDVGCIGCTACTRKQSGQPIKMGANNLPELDYETYDPATIDIPAIRSKCKRASLLVIGTPSPQDIEKTKDEEIPAVVQADFKTTMDETEYRG